jgi:hypothetical protein
VELTRHVYDYLTSLIWGLYTKNKSSDITGHGSHTKGRIRRNREREGNLKLENLIYPL